MSKNIVQGETFDLTVTLNNYPSPPWDTSMILTGAENVYEVGGLSEGAMHNFKIGPTTTLTYEPGDYKYRIVATDGTDVYTAWNGRTKVIADPTVPGNDMSHVEKVLNALNATIEGKATTDVLNYSIRGRSLGRMSPQELLDWRDKYLQFYKEELYEEDIANGLSVERGVIRVRL